MKSLFPSPPLSARDRGRLAKANGQAFERTFEAIATFQGYAVTRIPDGCRRVGRNLVPVKSPFDWVISLDGRSAMIDTKTIDGKTFSHSCIDMHQAMALAPHEKRQVRAGYVVELREACQVVFIPASVLMGRLRLNSRGSIAPTCPGVVVLGGCNPFSLGKIWL